MSPLTKNPYTFHRYPNSANRNIKKAIKAIKILTFYQQRRTPWYHVCEKQQRANSGQGWHFCHAQWTSNGYSYFRSSFTTSAFLYLKLPNEGNWQTADTFLVSGDSFNALRFPAVSGVEMKIYLRALQAPFSYSRLLRVLLSRDLSRLPQLKCLQAMFCPVSFSMIVTHE